MNIGDSERTMPTVDYGRHPAFRSFGENQLIDEAYVGELVAKVDAAWTNLQLTPASQSDSIPSRYQEQIGPLSAELEAHVTRNSNFRENFGRYVAKVFGSANEYMLGRLMDSSHLRGIGDEGQGNTSDAERKQRMEQDGFYHFGSDARLAAEIWRRTAWERSIGELKAERRPHGRAAVPLHHYSPAMASIRRALEEKGVYELANRYMKTEMELLYAALEFSHDRQSWYKGCYADTGIADAKTTYMHFDADHNVLKILLYLHDVDTDGGPFSYVGGSHLWQRSLFTLALLRGFDSEQKAIAELEEDMSGYKLKYYRPRFQLPEFRAELMKLPSILRGSTHFGDDVMDESPLSSRLLAGETTFAGGAGTMVLFDGSSGIHRGSLVRKGRRWAVQIGLKAKGTKHQIGTRRSSLIVGRTRYYLHRAKRQVLGE